MHGHSLKPGAAEEYKRLHENVPPAILKSAHEHGIRNQTSFYRDGYVFRYFEYVARTLPRTWRQWHPT